MSDHYVPISGVIKASLMNRPHLVILGAGASVAAFPNGDANGRKLPVMKDLVRVLGLGPLLRKAGVKSLDRNFEEIYSDLCSHEGYADVLEELEQCVYAYFSSLEIPEIPTIYDHIILSLRSKDVVATFNWDPFLIRTCMRWADRVRPPHTIYLHGNVAVGYCHSDMIKGPVGAGCPKCRQPFAPSRLLYPIQQKDYSSDPVIRDEWRDMRSALRDSYMVTVFGYSAPEADVEAVALLKEGWGSPEDRYLEEFEIIDIAPRKHLLETWRDFVHSHHYGIFKSFRQSWMARYPRRTCEALWACTMKNCPFEDHWSPSSDVDLAELWSWFEPYVRAEGKTT